MIFFPVITPLLNLRLTPQMEEEQAYARYIRERSARVPETLEQAVRRRREVAAQRAIRLRLAMGGIGGLGA